jgi:ABC-type uncharacterized transport system substrate-binding protein
MPSLLASTQRNSRRSHVILTTGTGALGRLLQATSIVPIVFVQVTDPVGGGFVRSLARPGGNATGFSALEYGMSGKWLELLKQIVPTTARAVVLAPFHSITSSASESRLSEIFTSSAFAVLRLITNSNFVAC